MEENAKTEQHLDDEQLQDVTGGGLFNFGRSSLRANNLAKIDNHQTQATILFQRADQLRTKNPTLATVMKTRAGEHLDEINRLSGQINGGR